MRIFPLLIVMAVLASGCRTTEANYRAAYDKAVAGRDSAMSFENTVYGNHRRNIGVQTVTDAKGDTAEMRTVIVKVTADGGGIREWLKPYSVVVGQFKTLTNALSLRERIVDAGYPGAFVVENGEPYYFVVLSSHATQAEAIESLSALKKSKFPFLMKAPLPFVLHNGRRR